MLRKRRRTPTGPGHTPKSPGHTARGPERTGGKALDAIN
jgi:hypothetical protein